MENLTQLTTRQWALYNLLKSKPDKWFTEKEIADAVEGYDYNENPAHSTTHCIAIYKDKNAINSDPKPDGIIVMKNHCFKYANHQEYLNERNQHIRALKKQVQFINNMDDKNDRNNQGKLLNSDLEEIKANNKSFYETYVKD